ncbi:hypothetical protein ACGFX8_25300 [Streptomyces sp. NPDC048362]|uniref:hypothetical protein n=1 Tax=Streptomyces sp. NPDC048362 TaxID=3365539 RepID=UPI00371A141E
MSGQEARELRELLSVVVEALTLPHDLEDYDARLLRRASLAKVIAGEALVEKTESLGWNADYLRNKLRAEERGEQL